MTNILLHFGYPKTGSSALQEFLYVNRDDLRKQGVYYPKSGLHVHEHHALVFAVGGNPYERWTGQQADELFSALRREIDDCGCSTVLLSSELFSARLAQIRESKEFARIFEGNDVRAICYLRRQDRWMESCFKQSVWEGHDVPHDVDTYIETQVMGADYYSFLNQWADFLGKDHVVPLVYEQAVNTVGCVRRFCSELGVDVDAFGDGCFDGQSNVSPGTLSTEIIHMILRQCDLSHADRAEVSKQITDLEKSVNLSVPRRLFSPDQCARIESILLESNQRLAREFVGQPLDGFWFRESP